MQGKYDNFKLWNLMERHDFVLGIDPKCELFHLYTSHPISIS